MGNICPKFPSVLLYPLFSLLNSYSSNNIGLVYSPCVISCFHSICCLTLVSIIACKASRLGPGSTGGASRCPKIPPFVNCRTDSCKKRYRNVHKFTHHVMIHKSVRRECRKYCCRVNCVKNIWFVTLVTCNFFVTFHWEQHYVPVFDNTKMFASCFS